MISGGKMESQRMNAGIAAHIIAGDHTKYPLLAASLSPRGVFAAGSTYTNNTATLNGATDYVLGSDGLGYKLIGATGTYSTQPSSDVQNWERVQAFTKSDLPPNIKKKPLQRLTRQAIRSPFYYVTQERVRLLLIGDSLAQAAQFLAPQLQAQFGCAGFFSPCGVTTMAATSYSAGGAVLTSSVSDFTVTPTGDYYTIASAGQASGVSWGLGQNSTPYSAGENFVVNGPKLSRNTPVCDTVKVAFIGGGGVFKVQYSIDYGTNWSDVASLTAVDSSGYASGSMQIVSGAITEAQVTNVRALWVSGSTKIYAAGAESATRKGVVISAFHKGSIQVGPDGLAGGNGAADIFASAAPDLVTCCALEGTVSTPYATAGIVPAQQAITDLCNALTVVPDILWYGIPNTSGDSYANTTIYNAAMKAFADFYGHGFVDPFATLGMWARENALGWATDATHPNTFGWFAVHQDMMAQFGFDNWAFGQTWLPSTESAVNLWAGNAGNWPFGTSFASLVTGSVTGVMPGLSVTIGGGTTGPNPSFQQVTLDQKESASRDRYGLRYTQAVTAGGGILTFSAGPARYAAGQQVTFKFKAKAAVAGTTGAMFDGRYAGTGSNPGDVPNQPITFGTAFKDYSYTVNLPQLINDEVAGTDSSFTLNNLSLNADITIKDVQIFAGPVAPKQHIPQRMMDTFQLSFASVAANAVGAAQVVAMIGIKKGQPVRVQKPAGYTAGVLFTAEATANDQVTIYPYNITTGALTPTANMWFTLVVD